ncbi:class F sortase [Propionibacteriaceae bacterium G1746]|uniref:class F sortase n=1 Tax=Aestuariimicrobium sp. G57 TaxID=3418485 RepID=UPI003C18ADE4
MRKKYVVGSSILLVLVLIAVIVAVQQSRSNTAQGPVGVPTTAATADTTPTATASNVGPGSSGSQALPATAETSVGSTAPTRVAANGCMLDLTPIVPTKFSIDRMKVNSPVLSLGEDESGAAAAPPKNASHSVAWWKNGPAIGSSKGHAVLSIHTYQNGQALGNELYDQSAGFKTNDLVRLVDDQGRTQCYTLEKTTKVWVKDYDPNSDVLYKFDGAPRAVIVICWDYNKSSKEWDSRILYYLKPVAQG